MKNTKNISLLILAVPLLTGTVICGQNKRSELVEAYDGSSLPITIDLNDYSDNAIREYYSELNNEPESERRGSNLLKNLKPILKNNQKYYNYDSGETIWKMYEITDRDWKKSKAEDITSGTYNASTKVITNYKYNVDNPYIHALYINRDVENETRAWGNHNQDQWGINREHVWPKALGFDTGTGGGARGDPMHLMAGNGYVNNIHSNDFYGYVDTSVKDDYKDCGSIYPNQKGNLSGKSKTLGGSRTVFEPQDCDKGDIARAIFYMVARYNYLSGSDSDGINSNNPNLEIVDNLSAWKNSGYQSTTTETGKIGLIQDLLEWNKNDPVDEFELHRNNLLCRNFTNNRNPFIDFPQWADLIWGLDKESKSANPLTDEIARPTEFVPPEDKADDGLIFGLPKLYVYIGAGVVAAIILIVVVIVMAKGTKKQKRTLKKVGKKVIKSTTKAKKRK